MISFCINRTKSLIILTAFVMHGFMIAETALPIPQNSIQQVALTETPAQKTDLTEQTDIPAAEASELDTLLNNIVQQTSQIDSLLQDIALVTSNNQSLSKIQRSALAKEIRTLRDQLSFFKNQSFTQADEQSIYLLLIINKELCDHLEKALAQGFTCLDPFPLEKHFSRAVQLPLLTINQLTRAIVDNEISVAKLSRSAENIGLTWYNKLYRGIDGYVFQPWQKYNLTHYGAIILGVTAASATAWWLYKEPSQSDNWFAKQINSFYGPAPKYGLVSYNPSAAKVGLEDSSSWATKAATIAASQQADSGKLAYELLNKDELKLAGIIKDNAKDFGLTPMAISLYAWSQVKGDYYKSKNYLYKKTVELHNNLKGGVFKNKTIKTSFEDYFKKPTCTFEDIIGAENAKRIFSDVIDYLISPEKFDLAKITPEKGYLLTGPARTGKTYIAEAFAGEVRKRMTALGKNPDNVHFLSATHDEINRLGGIKDLLAIAKFYAPCILFIDEIDLLGLQRGGTNSMLADFLVGLSDFSHQDSDKQVIVIAATNRSENLDDALKRRGRLGVEIRFTYPSADYRKDFFVHKLESIGIATDTIDIDSLVRQTVGKSFNDLDSILKKALHNAKNLVLPLDQMLLEQAIDSEIFLILPENDHPLSETERQLIAASIAGEALINYVLDTGALVVRATINPYLPILQEKSALAGIFKEEKEDTTPKKQQALIKYGKVFVVSDFEFLNEHCTSEQIKNTCKQLLAGRCAQQILLGVISHNKEAKDNMQKCYALAKELVGKSIELSLLSDKMRDSFADEAFDLVTTMEQEVTTLLTEHKDKLEQLATALLKLNTLNSDTIAYIVDGQLAADIAKEKEKEKAQDTTTIIEHPAVA
jgi:cell division protease FtsH